MVCIVAAVQGELLLTRSFILFLSLRVAQASIHVFVLQKIFPALKKYYEELGGSGSFVMISTCSEKQGMCMYYVPLSEKEAFYIGNELTEEYAAQYAGASFVEKFLGLDFNDSPLPSFGIGGTKVSNVFKGIKKLLGISSKTSGKEEL